jgi:hypothetical protein
MLTWLGQIRDSRYAIAFGIVVLLLFFAGLALKVEAGKSADHHALMTGLGWAMMSPFIAMVAIALIGAGAAFMM